MTQTIQPTRFDRAGFEAFLAERSEPAWLVHERRRAWEAFTTLGYPQRRDEEWSRTDIRLFHLDAFGFPGGEGADDVAHWPLLADGVDLGGRLATYNSREVETVLDPLLAEQGVILTSLDRAAREHEDLLRSHLFAGESDDPIDKFAALHRACWSGGALLYVPKSVAIDKPLHLLSSLGSGGADLGHTLVIVDEGAEATLLTEMAGDDGAALHCGAMDFVIRRGAKLRLVSLQNWGKHTWHFARQRATVAQNASLQWTVAALGARTAKVNQDVIVDGPGARVQVNGVMFTTDRQHLAYHTRQHHRAPSCESDLLYKGALQDRSRIVWRGMIKVDPGAQKTNAYQRDDNLMLSDHARADSIPGLEIEADDVICTHGATAGAVDEEQVFYARCRGLSRQEATRMIVAGFFQQVFDRITIESVREALGRAIGARVRELP